MWKIVCSRLQGDQNENDKRGFEIEQVVCKTRIRGEA